MGTNEARPVTIYALCDDAGAIHYVGQTRYPKRRGNQHRRTYPELTFIVVTRTDEAHADDVERRWIAHYRAQGAQLLNSARYIPHGAEIGRGSRHTVALVLRDDVMVDLRAEAQRRTLPPATAARMLLSERLAQLYDEECADAAARATAAATPEERAP